MAPSHRVRICLIYDCLYPWTVGGGERWYRNLSERLAADGHAITYVTLRQWPPDAPPQIPGVRVVAVGPQLGLYGPGGQRRIAPPLIFGAGVLAHLARHGRDYDVVHTASFPYFSLLAAGLARRRGGYRLVVDWFELWTREYWRSYLGERGGRVGWQVQALCARIPQQAFCFARVTAGRLREVMPRGEATVLEGMFSGPQAPRGPNPASDEVVFAGRHIPEKRAPALVPALALAREHAPALRGRVLGDGPERPAVRQAIADLGLEGVVDAPGFVSAEEVDHALGHAMAMVLPSRREGYGMVVVEAASRGTPSVVVADPDNAAVELVEDGENGFVAASASPEDLADAILQVRAAGPALRERTAAWYARNARRLSLEHSLERVAEAYRR